MKSDNLNLPFEIAIIASFSVANSLISAPFYKDSIIPFFAGLLLWAAVVAAYIALRKKVVSKLKNKYAVNIINALVALAAMVVSALAFSEYTDFIYGAVLLRSQMWVIKAVFALCVYFIAVSGKNAVYKFSFLSAVLSGTVFIVLFFLSAKTFNISNLKGVLNISDFSFFNTAKCFLKMFLPAFACIVFILRSNEKFSVLTAEVGVSCGALLCLVVMFDAILSFGLPFSARLSYPYINDISTVTVGSLFTRMDGFAYFAFFSCYLVKCGVCVKLASSLIYRGKHKKVFTGILSAALVLF